jgi:hypothetical protein
MKCLTFTLTSLVSHKTRLKGIDPKGVNLNLNLILGIVADIGSFPNVWRDPSFRTLAVA